MTLRLPDPQLPAQRAEAMTFYEGAFGGALDVSTFADHRFRRTLKAQPFGEMRDPAPPDHKRTPKSERPAGLTPTRWSREACS